MERRVTLRERLLEWASEGLWQYAERRRDERVCAPPQLQEDGFREWAARTLAVKLADKATEIGDREWAKKGLR